MVGRTLSVAAVVLFAGSVNAAIVDTLDFSQGWGDLDTRTGGSSTLSSERPRNGNGSLRMAYDSAIAGTSQAKASVIGGLGIGVPFGRVGDLVDGGSLTYDWYRDGSSTTVAYQFVQIKLHVANATGAPALLVWEGVYNGIANATTDAWVDDQETVDGNWWIRSGGTNFDVAGGFQSLNWFLQGNTVMNGGSTSLVLDFDTVILGIELGVGSGLSGTFIGYADDVTLAFGNGVSFNYNFEIPAPGAIALALLAGVAGVRRRR
ncbi:MAG: hypothetical protein EA380_08660 [Phycisphaeraceae bacterium]|nr:MAG: hypothetical protein EA380_08660 [Phycisphaeraceae bacterium]